MRIIKPDLDNGETDISGISFRAQRDWKMDWADFDSNTHWSRVNRYESCTAA